MAKTEWLCGERLPESVQIRLREMIGTDGEKRAAKTLGVSVTAILRGAANAGLRQGTIRLIETGIAALDNKSIAA